VPLNNRYQGREVEYAVNHSGARIIIVQKELFPAVARVRPALASVERYVVAGETGTIPDVDNFGAWLEDVGEPDTLPPVREDALADKIQEAVDVCPVNCIHWADEPE
jgi:acyl-CoA synthetase (AMP-forming)/AMP-acid ligase II